MQKRGAAQIYIYGETPIATLKVLLMAAKISSTDHYVELGSGRGVGCLWVASHIGCDVVGIEWAPRFVFFARLIAKWAKISASFQKQSFFEADLSKSTVVYLYAIHLSDEEIRRLTPVLETMPPHSRLITISEPLQSKSFRLDSTLEVVFPWGSTTAFILEKKD